MQIITDKYELYPDLLIVLRPFRGWGGDWITVPRKWDKPAHMTLEEWRDYALSIVARELPDMVTGPVAPPEPELPTVDVGCAWTREAFCEYLRTVLIPDLIESGSEATAYDFKVALSFILNSNPK